MSIDETKQYYDKNAMNEWARPEEHPFEFIFTCHMMDAYIKAGDSILDIGGGPGRYSIHYARQGCKPVLVDLSRGNIAVAHQKAAELGVDFPMYVENCLNLDSLPLGQFDHVFLMGPLYHLKSETEREAAVRLALSRLKPGGKLYCSFILDFSGLIYFLKTGEQGLAGVLKNPSMAKLVDSITEHSGYDGPAFTSAYFINQAQIEPFMERFEVEKLHLFGQEGILAPNESSVLSLPKAELEAWIETAKRLLELPEYLSFSEHAMYIGRKTR